METTEELNYSELFKRYAELNKNQYPNLILPRIRPIPPDIIPPKFKGALFDKGYETLNLKDFLNSKYPGFELFITSHNRATVENDLKLKYRGYTIDYFKQKGLLKDVSLNHLNYYQSEVGINGRHPLNSNINEPVLAVKYVDSLILYNGYHRASIFMITGKSTIQTYILNID